MGLMERLEAAKEKTSLDYFEVRITETLQKNVVVKAHNRQEAEKIVNAKWKDSVFILDAGDFKDVKFSVLYGEPRISLDKTI